ncbi:hypothetical protein [Leuconostoc carnosum]|uniref:hypothetical protein n=1 Tax=Leuconostoc carnosum TaxID=1252 RepID=UPI0012394337|nr:hypothetical protein [Leuconostoc carnosum]KAA8377144.1 hypothetical protein FE405_07515 [Leuconostoc carnosum]
MEYTFDEAVNSFQKACEYGKPKNKTFGSEQIQVANAIIELLRKEYAPTVEMTQQQKDVFLLYKKMTWFDLFLSKLNEPDNRELSTLPNLSSFDNWGVSKERENELMQAWLHPETIKVIDE